MSWFKRYILMNKEQRWLEAYEKERREHWYKIYSQHTDAILLDYIKGANEPVDSGKLTMTLNG